MSLLCRLTEELKRQLAEDASEQFGKEMARQLRHREELTVLVPVEKLGRVTHFGEPVKPWKQSRLDSILKAYDQGKPETLPPIRIAVDTDGTMEVGDGIHRLTAARMREKPLRVRFVRGNGEWDA